MSQEILNKIAKYKQFYEAETDADLKAKFKKKYEALEAELAEKEKVVEKKEEQAVVAEEKKISEAEEKLKKYESFIAVETDDNLKKRFQARIDELKKKIEEEKKQIKAEAKVTTEAKEAVKKVKTAKTKTERTKAVKVAKKKLTERKKVATSKVKRTQKLKSMLSDLDKLIKRNKLLNRKYGGKNVDLKRDSKRSAKPFGYRFVGEHDYRVPTPAQIKEGLKDGTIDYEGRPNRADKFPKGYKKKADVKLADGGNVKGGFKRGGRIQPNKESDKQRFAKPNGYRWKNEAVKDGIVKKAALSKTPSKKMRQKYPDYIDFESRLQKSDKRPSRRYTSV